MTRFVQTSKESAFGGLILPESHVEDMLKRAVAGPGAYSSTRLTNKNTANWETSTGSADSDTIFDLSKIRSQARDLDRNNAIAGGAVNNLTTNVIGEGLRSRSRINYERLGFSYEEADAKQNEIDFLFHTWASSALADVTKTQNFYEMCDLVFRNFLVSGDVGVLRRYKDQAGSLSKIALQIIEADRISNPFSGNAQPNLRAGVELDDDGAPIAYHISKRHPGDIYFNLTAGASEWVRVPAFDEAGGRLFLHIFRRLRPDQTRGVSYLAAIIEPLKQLGRYTEAELTAAVISACFAVFIKSEAPSGINGGLPGTIPGVINGTQATPTGTGLTKLQSGMIADLAPGESIEVADPKRPNTAFDPFVMALVRQIGMQLEQPYETLIKHYTSSFTAARAAMLDLWKTVKTRRAFIIAHFCNPVREWVLTDAILSGRIEAPGFFEDPFKKAAWLNCVWSGPTMGHINPSVEADAEMKWVGMGYKDLAQGAMEHFGNDWEEVADQRERELNRYVTMPVLVNPSLVTTPIDPNQKSPAQPQPIPADNESDDGDNSDLETDGGDRGKKRD